MNARAQTERKEDTEQHPTLFLFTNERRFSKRNLIREVNQQDQNMMSSTGKGNHTIQVLHWLTTVENWL